MPIDATEMTEFWRWLANGTLAVAIYFLAQLVSVQRAHAKRLNNHGQRLAKLDGELEETGD